MVSRFPNETSALVMVFSLLEEEKVKWQKVTIRAEDIAWIKEVSKDVGARANQTGILRGSTGYLKGLTAIREVRFCETKR